MSWSAILRGGQACLLAATWVGMALAQHPATPCGQCREWNRPQAPFQIFGNSYYVGTRGLTSILVTSEAGHVLIDGALPESAQQIVANIRSLGFRVEDVKIILNSHVHFDHAGGIAELQRLSGARVMASGWSAAVMRKGGVGKGDPQYGALIPIAPVKNVHEVRDGESLRVGGIEITAHLSPGHTPGGTSWTWKSCEDKICHEMVYADSVTPVSADRFKFSHSHTYPTALEDFRRTFSFLETAPCEVLITAHPEVSELFGRVEARKHGTADAIVDTGACRHLAEEGRERLRQRLAEEQRP
jgi:metallo-beta-lactamase class B